MKRFQRVLLVGAMTTLHSGIVRADNKQCANAFVEAQKFQKAGQLTAAKEQYVLCASKDCLAAVRDECLAKLDDIEKATPTVVVAVTSADGSDLTEVTVYIDGEQVADSLDGSAISVDPGKRVFRVEIPGADSIEKTVVIRAGEKNRQLKLAVKPEEKPSPADPSTTEPDDVPVEISTSEGGPGVLPWIIGGVGLVAVGVGAVFWLGAESKAGDLEDAGCEPNCAQDDVDSVKQQRLFGDIALGVGLVGIGVAAYLLLTGSAKTDTTEDARLPIRLAVTRGGFTTGFSARF